MRILAVRGTNLASLPQFDLDLASDPIGGTGIFAITGPTGSGKSTILDAICLALFNRVPRLADAESKAMIIGENANPSLAIRYNDVRNILRHGCTSGLAQVDFVGQDGRTYRAEWRVSRSWNRSDGKLQDAKQTLIDLATREPIGHKKGDTLVEIERRVGLDFDQFRRAALLAQGEFDSFVRAKPDERAALLERITATDIYSRVSRKAFERAKRDREAAESLRNQLEDLHPLDTEERLAIEQRVTIARTTGASLDAQLTALRNAQTWYVRESELMESVARGQRDVDDAERSDAAATADRTCLTRAQAAFAARSELEASDMALDAYQRAVEDHARAERAHTAALTELRSATSQEACARDAAATARQAYDDIGPELSKATELDGQITQGVQELTRREQARTSAVDAANRLRNDLVAKERALGLMRDHATNVDKWLADHATSAPIALRLDEILRDLNERFRADTALDESQRQLLAHEEQRQSVTETTERLSSEKDKAAEREHTLLRDIGAVEASIATFDRAVLERRRDIARQALDLLAEARRWNEESVRAMRVIDDSAAADAEQSLTIETSRRGIADTEVHFVANGAALREAQRSLDFSTAATDEQTQRLRAILVEGEPCPVCGATEHQLHAVDSLLHARVELDRERVTELQETITAAHQSKARAEANIEAATRELARLHQQRGEAQAKHDRSEIERARCDHELALIADTLGERDFESVVERATAALLQLDDHERVCRELAAERELVRRKMSTVDDDLAKARKRRDAHTEAIAMLESRRASAKMLRHAATDRLDRFLGDATPEWQHLPLDQIDELCRNAAATWNERDAERRRLASDLPELEASKREQLATTSAAEQRSLERDSEWREQQRAVANLREVRRGVIGGRVVGEVRTDYCLTFETAQQLAAEAMKRAATARTSETTERTELSSAIAQVAQRGKASTDAQTMRDARFVSLNIDEGAARGAIARGEGWLDLETRRLDALRNDANVARAVILERRRMLEQHCRNEKPETSRSALPDTIATTARDRGAIDGELHALSAQLQFDNDCRAQTASLGERLVPAEARADVSARLGALIGSADGRIFRDFAQSLTFERLVALANHHLRTLHPRFELKRTQGKDLALQVLDHDMGDEVRGVHSLSGGERFLVSLALALGLASMSSAHGVKVESLFIDEGFGALDSNNLSMAIAALERLQASGCQIGIISHLDTLQDRIGVRVEVTPERPGRSRIEIING